jgi:hypothetical protein
MKRIVSPIGALATISLEGTQEFDRMIRHPRFSRRYLIGHPRSFEFDLQ